MLSGVLWGTSISFRLFATVADGQGNPPSDTFKVAVVTTIGVVLAAAITALAATFQRDKSAPLATVSTTQDLIAELARRAEAAERREQILHRKYELIMRRVDELEGYCWRHQIDPDTGHAIVPGVPGSQEAAHGGT